MSQSRKILPYAIVVLLAYIGFALPLPILPEMFLDPVHSILPGYPQKQKLIALGVMMASFPLGQFFGSPIIGHLSDLYGRKRIVLFSLFGTMVGYLITAFSVSKGSLWGMFAGLSLCGFCEGNITIGQSVIVDLAEKEADKARYFGLLNAFISLGFIIGPLMGGQLANSKLVPWFTFATPFWGAAIMTLLGLLLIALGSKETLHKKKRGSWNLFSSLLSSLKMPKLSKLYVANFFLALGYFSFFRFFPVFLKEQFNFNPSYLSFVMVYGSLTMIIAVLWLVPRLAKRFASTDILRTFAALFALSIIICIAPPWPYALLATIPLTGACLAVTITNGSLLISNHVSLDFQGRALGTLTSIQVLAETITGFLGGFIASEMQTLPLLFGALMCLGCTLLLSKRKTHV
jgi:DHA1 family tetracycline resistance protein-like MFS transporter